MSKLRLFAALMLTFGFAANSWAQSPANEKGKRSAQTPLTRAELREKLETPINVEFVETAFKDVVAYFADSLKVQIILDDRSFEEAAISIDTPITYKLQDLKAATALRMIMRDLGEGDFDFVQRDGYLEINACAKLDRELEPRTYLVRELPGVRSESPDVSQVVNLLQSAVEPSSWKKQSGEGTITHLGPILVIRQSPRVHDRIADLLHEAREAIAQAANAKQ